MKLKTNLTMIDTLVDVPVGVKFTFRAPNYDARTIYVRTNEKYFTADGNIYHSKHLVKDHNVKVDIVTNEG